MYAFSAGVAVGVIAGVTPSYVTTEGADEYRPKSTVRAFAATVKSVGQGFIGFAIVATVAAKFLTPLAPWIVPNFMERAASESTLSLVAHGLQYAAALDLAYMLFTPALDEAVQPLILGLAAAAILEISKPDPTLIGVLAIGTYCILIGLLFYVRREFKLTEADVGG
jgi:dipeptide/tripeptide permease